MWENDLSKTNLRIFPDEMIVLAKVKPEAVKEEVALVRDYFPQIAWIVVNKAGGDVRYMANFYDEISWEKFDQDRQAECPISYKILSNAYRAIGRLRKKENKPGWATPQYDLCRVALWIHPDASIPVERYVRMSGNQFPGSPSQ